VFAVYNSIVCCKLPLAITVIRYTILVRSVIRYPVHKYLTDLRKSYSIKERCAWCSSGGADVTPCGKTLGVPLSRRGGGANSV
jgi:hypothetical protein